MQGQRAAVLPSFFARVGAEDWDSLPSFFAADIVWETGPPSVSATMPQGGKLTSVEAITEAFKAFRKHVVAKIEGVEVHQILHDTDSPAMRATGHGIARDGEPYHMPFVFFVDFEPGTSKIKRVNEVVDSAYAHQRIDGLMASASA
ncbi:hypothetical protein JCM6882_007617 [Rhodosporidiobolus microsporus]